MTEIPGHKTVDAGLLRRQLAPWFSARLAGPATVEDVAVPEGQGFSAETVFVDVAVEGALQRFVVKLAPTGDTIFPTYDLSAQFRCMRAVRDHTDVPAAPVRWFDDGSVLGRPFYVMDRVDGDIPADNLPYTMEGWLLAATPAEQQTLYDSSLDVLAGLHRMDWAGGGLHFLDRPEFGPTGLEQQLGQGAAYLDWVAKGRTQPVPEAALARLHKTLPADPPPIGLSWGDSRIGNIIYQSFQPVAVLDWEMAALVPAEVDLAWFLYMHRFFTAGLGVTDLPGFPSEATAVTRYEQRLGRPVHDLDWYLLWAGFRYGVVMVRMVQKMAAAGVGEGWDEHDNLAVNLLSTLL